MNVTCLTGFHGSPASPRCDLHALDLMFSGLRETELVFLPRQGQFAVTLLFALGFFFSCFLAPVGAHSVTFVMWSDVPMKGR